MTFAFEVPAGALAPAVKYAARWLTTKPVIAAHGGLLFEIPALGDRLSIFGFNENATGRASVDVKSDDHGAFVVSGRLLDQLVSTFPDKPVRFELDGTTIAVSAGRWRGTLPAMAVEDYPALPGQAALAGYVDGASLADAVHRVGAAASRDLTKQVSLCGLHLTFDDDYDTAMAEPTYTLTFMATDTYRGAMQTIEWTPDAEGAPIGENALMLAATMVDAVEAFVGPHAVAIGWEPGAFSLSTPDRSLSVRTLDAAEFPATGLRPIFMGARPAAMTLRTKDLAQPLKRADLMRSREVDVVRLRLSENLLTLAVSGDVNAGDEEIDVEYAGPETEILVKSATVQAALHSAPGDTVTMAFFPGATKPALITSPADPAWRHILVPLKDLR